MQIVIDIPEEIRNDILADGVLYVDYVPVLRDAIKNCTPLPKGHGRLIDADKFQKDYCDANCGNRQCVDAMDKCMFIGELVIAPTIIEADKERE